MSILKKTVVALTAVMVSATLFGCGDTSYILKADDDKVGAGVYLYYASTELGNQITTLQYSGVTEDFLDQKIGDDTLSEYVEEVAMKSLKEHVATNAKFDELGLELSEADEKEISSIVNESWNTSKIIYEAQGIGKESFREVITTSKKDAMIFDYFYSKEGVEAVSDEDIINYIEENYLRYKVLSFPKATTEEGEEDTSKASFDKYLEKAKDVTFEDFDKLIEEYEKETAEETEEATDTEVDTDAEETEKDPYVNEQLSNYAQVDEEAEDTFSVVLKELKGMENGAVSSYEDEYAYYIYIKGAITGRSKEYTEEDNRLTTLQEMKGEEFQGKVDEWVKALKVDINDKAIDRYSVETILEKMENASK